MCLPYSGGLDAQVGTAAALAQRTPRAAEKLKDGSSKNTLKTQGKDQTRDMLYYAQKLWLAETDRGEAAECWV